MNKEEILKSKIVNINEKFKLILDECYTHIPDEMFYKLEHIEKLYKELENE